MTTPTKHPKTGTYRLRLAVPADLRETTARLYGQRGELLENLHTKEPAEAKARCGAALARLQARLQAARATKQGEGAQLSDRDVAGLAGEFYRAELDRFADDLLGGEAGWEAEGDRLSDQINSGDGEVTLSRHDIADATELLYAHGRPADADAIDRVGRAIYRARWSVLALMQRRLGGDWTPDKVALTFPEPPAPVLSVPVPVPSPVPPAGVTFGALLAGWGQDRGWSMDAKPISRGLYDRNLIIQRLVAFLGHDDPARVTKADAVRWKEARQGGGAHASTVTNDLSACSAIWGWGQQMAKIPGGLENPFSGISPPKAKRKTGRRAFTDEEAGRVLVAARAETGPTLRWLPWLLCLSGARLGEVCQSTREDIALVDSVLVLRIHDDEPGRSLKNEESRRNVPIHPALVAEGFTHYVAGLKPGSALFPDMGADAIFGRRSTLASKRLAYWLRNTVDI